MDIYIYIYIIYTYISYTCPFEDFFWWLLEWELGEVLHHLWLGQQENWFGTSSTTRWTGVAVGTWEHLTPHSQIIHVWYIFNSIETPFLWPSFVGQYSSTMDDLGLERETYRSIHLPFPGHFMEFYHVLPQSTADDQPVLCMMCIDLPFEEISSAISPTLKQWFNHFRHLRLPVWVRHLQVPCCQAGFFWWPCDSWICGKMMETW